MGLGSTLLPGVLWAKLRAGAEIDDHVIIAAAELAGVSFNEDERRAMLQGLRQNATAFAQLVELKLDNSVAPAIGFNPLPPNWEPPKGPSKPPVREKMRAPAVTGNLEDLAFEPVTVLSELVRTKKVTSTALTKMYLERLKRLNGKLLFYVNLTEERALKQAADADAEIARGRYRGALHGIPWGAKDLIAVKGYPTTWGATPLKEQMLPEDAAVVQRLDEAGAVLVAKLTLGALAQGDRWFGGQTKNPWAPDTRGSSGSSAGPASATAAG
ncbi:MAG TPA: amidase, partial [Gemmatimonadaceae bacterium]